MVGPWVDCLRTCWETEIAFREPKSIDIHLVDLAFADAAGKSLLRTLHEQGACLTAADLITRGILEEVTRDGRADDVEGDDGTLGTHHRAAHMRRGARPAHMGSLVTSATRLLLGVACALALAQSPARAAGLRCVEWHRLGAEQKDARLREQIGAVVHSPEERRINVNVGALRRCLEAEALVSATPSTTPAPRASGPISTRSTGSCTTTSRAAQTRIIELARGAARRTEHRSSKA